MIRRLLVAFLALLGAVSCASLLWHVNKRVLNEAIITHDVQTKLCVASPACKSMRVDQVFSAEEKNWRPMLVIFSNKNANEADELLIRRAIETQGVLAAMVLKGASIKWEMGADPSIPIRYPQKKKTSQSKLSLTKNNPQRNVTPASFGKQEEKNQPEGNPLLR